MLPSGTQRKDSYKTRKNVIKAMAFLLILCCVGFFVMIPKAHAEFDPLAGISGLWQSFSSTMSSPFFDIVESADEGVKEKLDLLQGVLMQDMFDPLYDMFAVLGIGMCLINTILLIIHEIQREDATMDFWLKTWIQLCISIVVVSNLTGHGAVNIMDALDTAGQAIIDTVEEKTSGLIETEKEKYGSRLWLVYLNTVCSFIPGSTGDTVAKAVVGIMPDDIQAGLASDLSHAYTSSGRSDEGYNRAKDTAAEYIAKHMNEAANDAYTALDNNNIGFVNSLGIKFGSWLLGFVIDGIIFILMIKFVLRKTFMPLAVADMASEGLRSPGLRYMKRYVALYIQEAAIVVVVFAGTLAQCIICTIDPGADLYLIMVIKGAMAALMAATEKFSREILGE